MKIVHKTH